MPTIDELELPGELVAELQRLVEDADPELVLEFARSHPDLVKGVQVKKSSVPLIRRRLAHAISACGTLKPDWREFLAPAGLTQDLVVVLSDAALAAGFVEFLALYGRERFLAAVLLDSRPDVRQLAVRFLRQPAPPAVPDRDEALRRLQDMFAAFGVNAAAWFPAGAAGPADAPVADDVRREVAEWRDRAVRLEGELDAARAQRRSEKGLQDKVEKLKQRVAELEQALDSGRQRAAAETRLREQAGRDVESGRAELAAVQAELERRVRDGVDREMRAMLRAWLPRVLQAEQVAQRVREAPAGDDVLARAEAALERQAQRDRASGNRRLLCRRLADVDAALARVREALADALNPAPDLVRAATELEDEAARLRAVVQPERRQLGGFAETLRARMATVTEGEDLNRLHALLAELGEAELVPTLELQALYAAYQDRMAQLYDRYAPAKPRGPEPMDPAWALLRKAAENEEFLLLVDGHNVLHGIPELFAAWFEGGLPGAQARARLVQLTAALVREAPGGEARVYFDGPTRSDIAHGSNVKEIYSGGGTREQRADEVILEDIEYCRTSRRAHPWILVTDDRDLRAKARDFGAATMPVAQFAAVLTRVADSLKPGAHERSVFCGRDHS